MKTLKIFAILLILFAFTSCSDQIQEKENNPIVGGEEVNTTPTPAPAPTLNGTPGDPTPTITPTPTPSPNPGLSSSEVGQYWLDLYGVETQLHVQNLQFLATFNLPGLTTQRLAKAKTDQCFYGLDRYQDNIASFLAHYPGDFSDTDTNACVQTAGLPKVNQSYVWGLVQEGQNLWFGTLANTLCLVISGLGITQPFQNSSWECEAGLKDVRPPRLYYYSLTNNQLNEITPKIINGGDLAALKATTGIRSCEARNFIVRKA